MVVKKRTDQENLLKKSFFEKLFTHENSKTTLLPEIYAGISGALIVIFAIISSSRLITTMLGVDINQYMGAVIAISILLSSVLCILGGIYSKLPVIFSNSLSYTSFISVSIVSALALDWKVAMGVIIFEGLLFIILCFTPFFKIMFKNIPSFFEIAALVTLGGILILFSLISGKFISFKGTSELFSLTLRSPESFLFIISIIIIFILYYSKVKGFILYGLALTLLIGMFLPKVPGLYAPYIILIGLFVGWILLYAVLIDARKRNALEISLLSLIISMIIILIFYKNPESIIVPPSRIIGENGIFAFPQIKLASEIISKPILSFGQVFSNIKSLYIPILSLLFTHIITFYAILKSILVFSQENHSEREIQSTQKRSTILDGCSNFISGSFGVGANSLNFGSLAAISAGGKTGLTSLFAAITFLISLFMLPLFALPIFSYVVAPALFVIGIVLIIKSVDLQHIQKNNFEDILPIILCFIVGTLTLNIVQGILAGIMFYVIIKLIEKKYYQINTFTWVLVIISLIFSFYRINIPFLTIYNF